MSRYNTIVRNLAPRFRCLFDGDIAEEIHSLPTYTEAGDQISFASSIIPTMTSQSIALATAGAGVRLGNSWYVNDGAAPDKPEDEVYSFIRRSVSLWFIIDQMNALQCLWEEGGGTNSWAAFVEGGEVKIVMAEGGAVTSVASSSGFGISEGQLCHLLMTCNTSNDIQTLYLNGRLAASSSCGVGEQLSGHGGDWVVGGNSDARNPDDSVANGGFIGRAQDYLYWHEVELGQADALALYRAGIGDDEGLLSSVNLYPFDVSSNPGGLAAGGYLVEEGGVSLVGRTVRAMAGATASIQTLPTLDVSAVENDADAITALVAPASAHATAVASAASSARAAVPPFDFTLL
ncbi:LamG-like jellyroll fold domain-containing protein [Oceanicaulis sp.]|uniref:LamG-like jellyroll fold domain-containing protein n=1 Tax=Oceanicaulis sp. TaxID=1924941 RepID=UPI003F70A7B0